MCFTVVAIVSGWVLVAGAGARQMCDVWIQSGATSAWTHRPHCLTPFDM